MVSMLVVGYYHRQGGEDENRISRATYIVFLPTNAYFSLGYRGRLIFRGSSRESPSVYIWFGDEGPIGGISIGRNRYDCNEPDYQTLRAWAVEQLREWTERLQSLGMDALVEETSRQSPFIENPEQYNVPSRK